MHDMQSSTIGFAPLKDFDDKPVPQRASIPDTILEPTIPPTFYAITALATFSVICYVLAAALIQPLMDRYYSFDNTDDQWKYYAVYISYGLWCAFIFFLIVMPLLNIPMSELEKDLTNLSLGLFAAAGLTGVKSYFGSAKPAVV